jgi:hypothetical protein
MNLKLTAERLDRGAMVYIRQSTPSQVLHHQEGRRRQYALEEHARQLGFQRIAVIDEDLGRSAPDDDPDVIVNNLSDQSILDSDELALVKNRRRRRNITGIERAESKQGAQSLEPRIRRLSVFL